MHVAAKVHVCATFGTRLIGMLGSRRQDGLWMIIPCQCIHTFGMRDPIDIAFTDSGGIVVLAERNVAPNNVRIARKASFVLERFSDDSSDWLKPGESAFLKFGAMLGSGRIHLPGPKSPESA